MAALIYRLSGDYNPLHASPSVAKAAGFKKPILHGLCSLGVAGHAILKGCCDYDANRLKSLQLRFSSPVYPGETVRTEIWQDGKDISFKSKIVERDVVVLDNGARRLNKINKCDTLDLKIGYETMSDGERITKTNA